MGAHRRSISTVLLIPVVVPIIALMGCATSSERRAHNAATLHAERSLKLARALKAAPTTRAGFYLQAAETASTAFDAGAPSQTARSIYNTATAELVALLKREPEVPNIIPAPVDARPPYHLVWETGARARGIWAPDFFTAYKPAQEVNTRTLRQRIATEGYGGSLVGICRPETLGRPRGLFTRNVGVTAPVTATLDFKASKAEKRVIVSLNDPTKRIAVPLLGSRRPLAADFTAPLAYYPRRNELWAGLMGMIKVEEFLTTSGLTILTPYDPDRIPVIFVHGLASTPQMWLNVINEIEADPVLRGRCQYWMFSYSTGLPVAYSAMQLRENLEIFNRIYPIKHRYVLISHSMGGLVSRLQVTTSKHELWDGTLGRNAERLYHKVSSESLLKRSLVMEANPKVERIVFICTPHRGSSLAIGSLGALATHLISIPAVFVKTVESTIGGSLELLTGEKGSRFPTGIQSLSPNSTTMLALNKLPIQAPHHSIIGDRGRGDTPNSSDGVVPYWSSHLDSAESELIVPGPHSSYELPQTIDELRRILKQQVKK